MTAIFQDLGYDLAPQNGKKFKLTCVRMKVWPYTLELCMKLYDIKENFLKIWNVPSSYFKNCGNKTNVAYNGYEEFNNYLGLFNEICRYDKRWKT